MVKYLLAATALKLFSINGDTRMAYRKVGNILGQRMRKNQGLRAYVKRGDLLVSLCKEHGVMHDGGRFLELGTGWIHWYGLYARLHAELRVDLFDVWDNRQFEALKKASMNLRRQWESEGRITARQDDLLGRIAGTRSFDELYELLGLRYMIHQGGSLLAYHDDEYDCVYSFHVLEHVSRESLGRTVRDIYRILKQGGYSIHQIGIDDHLTHYDKRESRKNYLRYSQRTWKRFFENGVQYTNMLQGTDFLDLFDRTQFEFIDAARERCNVDRVPIHPEWQKYPQEDLETTILTIVHRKPE